MRFKYVCSDCGREYITDEIMYQCPECSKLNNGTSFPKGNLIVKLDKEVLKKAKEKDKALEVIYQEIEQKLKDKVGTKVSITSKGDGAGKLEIEFYNHDDLERIIALLSSN